MFFTKFLAVGFPLIVIIAAAFFTRLLTERGAHLLKGILFALMLSSGVIKQVYALLTGYNAWYLPLHFSFTFYITVGLSIFGRKSIAHFGSAVLFVGGFIMLTMILVSPAAVLGNLSLIFNSPVTFHGYFYHMLVVFQFFIMLFRGDYQPKTYDAFLFIAFVLLWGAIAVPVAFNLNANYMGVLQSYIPFLEALRINFGYPVYLLTYFLCVLTIAFFLVFTFYSVRKKRT